VAFCFAKHMEIWYTVFTSSRKLVDAIDIVDFNATATRVEADS